LTIWKTITVRACCSWAAFAPDTVRRRANIRAGKRWTCVSSRGVVDSRCNLPARRALGEIAAAHSLFEGGRWCNSDYGHAQIGVTAAACGDKIRIVYQ
jgi:hypothetical protein